ncbi:hypothetical protein [Thermus islandicus]|uniref:hypothetical protein n=1 Tax=Thermus islandicus TaxID=540988 RepID=UPI000413A5FE|nr:hypothetical protein [Thermus islandicus]
MEAGLIPVGPKDLYEALVLVEQGLGWPGILPALRQTVDEPLATLALGEELGLWRQQGFSLGLTLAGRAWLEDPARPPEALFHLLEALPWVEVLEALEEKEVLRLPHLLPLFPPGPRGEKAARALAEWGGVLGLWDYEERREEIRRCAS